MIHLTYPSAWALYQLIDSKFIDLLDDDSGQTNQKALKAELEKMGNLRQDRLDHLEYLNSLVPAHNELLVRLREIGSLYAKQLSTVKLIVHEFEWPVAM